MHTLARSWIDDVLAASPVARALGIEVVSARPEEAVLALAFRDDLTTVPGVLHGGVVATLVDIAGAAASASGLTPEDAATGGATTQLDVSYADAATTDLRATATVLRRTRFATHSQVVVRDTGDRVVALAQVTSRIFH
ncbi:PaaI family thioesterase [Nocardioides carbamazepini]|uniref:PaaI family thioesterase n=1 Tax=Nocardioides carbamazepini TaxID=2854259 RepID=UPI00214A6D68|nr:PaaI family thioesterase [Nocardioides carbamazepini]MCR1781974.1 PaaI family thioesterase [Nocardioides carbamazepini]